MSARWGSASVTASWGCRRTASTPGEYWVPHQRHLLTLIITTADCVTTLWSWATRSSGATRPTRLCTWTWSSSPRRTSRSHAALSVDTGSCCTFYLHWNIAQDDGRCPGAFHVGCDVVTEDPTADPTEDPTADPTADPTVDPTSAPSSGVNMSWNVVAQIFAFVASFYIF